jgi:hypothetical protein
LPLYLGVIEQFSCRANNWTWLEALSDNILHQSKAA